MRRSRRWSRDGRHSDLLDPRPSDRALVAAMLNVVFAFCLGCEHYLLGVRFRGVRATP
jgi:hypothetical protein